MLHDGAAILLIVPEKCPNRRDPAPLIRNCAATPTQRKRATAFVETDIAAPDGDGHGAHGQRDRGGSFGSAVRPRVAARAGRFGHSRRHNRSGRDRSSYRSALERGNGHAERNGLAFRPRRRAPDVDEVYNE
jgi:hypothetical protein